MKSPPLFSLIVPTINRTTELSILLTSLCHQTLDDFEVLIIDQNEDDRVFHVVNKFLDQLNIIHICQPEKGASKARNVGLRRAKGKIATFPDDDCEYPSDVLEKVSKALNAHPHVDGITVYCRDKNFNGSIARLSTQSQSINKYNILSVLLEATIFLKLTRERDIYFDENMGVGASTAWWSDEGPDLVLRLINQGAHFIYLPTIVIYHPNPVKIYDKKSILRSYKYGSGRGRYLKKHHYPLWFVFYVWGLYLVGIAIGCFQLNMGKIAYYWNGLKGRVKGYRDTPKDAASHNMMSCTY